ncbi:MAG: fumarylacetoacetate hydrolase family protein, partial [Planctomycetaceae bacterium]|nr:fumarylacetoacetate hydrolase family protein [Planctomycetaceae bacterium]
LDFELEFGVFLNRTGKNIDAADALSYIGGYALFNDFSAREIQLREMAARLGPAKGKDFDTGNAIGPYLVTPDEVSDPYDLTMRVRVNDEVWSETHSGSIQHRLPEILAFISQDETLYPGDFIAVGTLPDGCGLELDRWIQVGDTVSLECDRLGVLTNRIVAAN